MTKIKCWIVRNHAFSVQVGGLERLFVHFSKPTFVCEKIDSKDRDGWINMSEMEDGLYRKIGWISLNEKWGIRKLSVGNWIGFESELSHYIWNKLCEHFHNEPFDKWDELEKQGIVKQKEFLLELEIELKITN